MMVSWHENHILLNKGLQSHIIRIGISLSGYSRSFTMGGNFDEVNLCNCQR